MTKPTLTMLVTVALALVCGSAHADDWAADDEVPVLRQAPRPRTFTFVERAEAKRAPNLHVALVLGLGAPTGLGGVEVGYRAGALEVVGGVGVSLFGHLHGAMGLRGMWRRGWLALGAGAGASAGCLDQSVGDTDRCKSFGVMPYLDARLRVNLADWFIDGSAGIVTVPEAAGEIHGTFPSVALAVGRRF